MTTGGASRLTPSQTRRTLAQSRPWAEKISLPAAARVMGIFMAATRGTGKSTVLGRHIAFSDFHRSRLDECVPVVIIDPVGGTIDNFLDKIGQEDHATRKALFERVCYIEMHGLDDRVFPWPIFTGAFKGERYSSRAQRFVDVIERVDPDLRTRPMLGMNALEPYAKAAGTVLCALGLGITEMRSLVSDPSAWEDKLHLVETDFPEAVTRLRELGAMSRADRSREISSLQAKLSHFELDDNYRAMFGATSGGINWKEVFDRKLAVLLDFRHLRTGFMKRFCLQWAYQSFMAYMRWRGHNNEDKPVSFIVDELSDMVGSKDDELLTQDIDELVNRISRSHGIWFTLATQELFQLPPKIADTVLSAGTVIFGQTSQPEAAEKIARRFFPYDPGWVRKTRARVGQVPHGIGRFQYNTYENVGVDTVEFSMAEQVRQHSQMLLELRKGHFLIGQSLQEGELPTSLTPFTTNYLDTKKPKKSLIAALQRELMHRDGIPEQKILQDIRKRSVPTLVPSVPRA